ncbi:glycoside hydrolase family 10 protein [Flexithrix dorotheae]|uniref:glycoside hydrolase family 10 protein n=1 Tax=Flexithrix dorotheae TaxID=70993 RepID=UPI0003703B89|nr:family 10 glycosylhydrolase [Flexithrix dorotheae]
MFKIYLISTLLTFVLFFNPIFAQQEAPERELRGVWIATVLNIDWPENGDYNSKKQRSAFTKILDQHTDQGLNAVFVQIRPNANVFYKSKLEPWSEWLSGQQGKKPKPGYDPLKFMLEACRERGLEFHAWINPYRVLTNKNTKNIDKDNIIHKKPEWIVTHGNLKMLDPGIPEVQQYIVDIIEEILDRYEVDGIHFDDYFYPYPKKDEPFPDDETFAKYKESFTDKGDWRRNNVNNLIKNVYALINKKDPRVKFGVSPFGVWRNSASDSLGSKTTAGAPSYDSLYADTKVWLEKGWVDYMAPQIYWAKGFKPAAYDTLVNWWANIDTDRHIYIGQGVYKINNNYDSAWFKPNEIPDQIRYNRGFSDKIQGNIFYNSSSIRKNPNHVVDSLKQNLYSHRVLPPEMPWKPKELPNSPQQVTLKKSDAGNLVKWKKSSKTAKGIKPFYYAVYKIETTGECGVSKNLIAILPEKRRKYFDPMGENSQGISYQVVGLDKLYNEAEN